MTQLRTNSLITLLTASYVHVSQGRTPQNILQLWIMNTCCFVMTVCYGFSVLICFACLHLKQETILLMKSTISWDKMPCSLLKVNWRFGGTYHLHLQGRISRARCQHASKWQAPSETSVDFQWTTWRYIPEDSTLHSHSCENLKSYSCFDILPTGQMQLLKRYSNFVILWPPKKYINLCDAHTQSLPVSKKCNFTHCYSSPSGCTPTAGS
jgi:hypothetical protein